MKDYTSPKLNYSEARMKQVDELYKSGKIEAITASLLSKIILLGISDIESEVKSELQERGVSPDFSANVVAKIKNILDPYNSVEFRSSCLNDLLIKLSPPSKTILMIAVRASGILKDSYSKDKSLRVSIEGPGIDIES